MGGSPGVEPDRVRRRRLPLRLAGLAGAAAGALAGWFVLGPPPAGAPSREAEAARTADTPPPTDRPPLSAGRPSPLEESRATDGEQLPSLRTPTTAAPARPASTPSLIAELARRAREFEPAPWERSAYIPPVARNGAAAAAEAARSGEPSGDSLADASDLAAAGVDPRLYEVDERLGNAIREGGPAAIRSEIRAIYEAALALPDDESRIQAAQSLAWLGDPRAIPALEAALREPPPPVTVAAALEEALATLREVAPAPARAPAPAAAATEEPARD